VRDRRHRSVLIVILACMALSGTLGVAQTDATRLEEIVQVVESFRRLAILEPGIAGEVWMNEDTLDDWQDLVEPVERAAVGVSAWFVDAQPLAGVPEDGHPIGGLYSPWTGVLLCFDLDEGATTIEAVSVIAVVDPVESALGPSDLALGLMASLEEGSKAFEGAIEGIGGSGNARDQGRAFSDRVEAYDDLVGNAYGASTVGQAVGRVIDELSAGIFSGPLALLESEDEEWLSSLAPVWIGDEGKVALASSAAPLELVWLEIDEAAEVRSVSLIRLFDRVTTREGDDQ